MTDTPPTDLGDIVVVGQRRSDPVEPFPERPQPAVPPDGMFDELLPDLDGPPDPCASPETALEWNADAAAAEALRRMDAAARASGEPDFAAREYGTAIYLLPDGTFRIGTVRWGSVMAATVEIQYDEFPLEYLIATIHSHPASSGFSQDVEVLDYVTQVSMHGDNVRLYGVNPVWQSGNPAPRYALSVFNKTNIHSMDTPPEVNPEGTPWPGAVIL